MLNLFLATIRVWGGISVTSYATVNNKQCFGSEETLAIVKTTYQLHRRMDQHVMYLVQPTLIRCVVTDQLSGHLLPVRCCLLECRVLVIVNITCRVNN